MKLKNLIYLGATGLMAMACTSPYRSEAPLFEALSIEQSGIDFKNTLSYDENFNIYTYRNFYNGGGVAIGDIDNDGLDDIYFTGNRQDNKLYRNLGNLKFEDITAKAGVAGERAWSTGVSMADINGDGFLDLYICNSGDIDGDNKQNELFINNGDGTFTEKAEAFGLADQGFSTHAAFFDYDRDGDLDVYLLNNSYKAIGSFNLKINERPKRDPVGGDKLYRNDGGSFVDVSEDAGIYGSVIGFGLGVTVGDINNDNWPDIFISNDFFERDYLYVNQADGTFAEVLVNSMQSISAASMGADMADINNDLRPDIFVTDMLPEPDERLKQVTTFESWDRHHYGLQNGYHYQYTRNMLHLNNGDGSFSEVGRLAGIEATDWSWGALFFDMDNDGLKDLFVANGIYQDLTDRDYLNFIANEEVKASITAGGTDYKALTDPIPINPIPNYAYHNQGNLTFENKAEAWGLGTPVHSNGSAFGDLDNDGDLDLVVNNVNAVSNIFENKTNTLKPENHYIKFDLKGEGMNQFALGAKIEVKAGEDQFMVEQMPIRGFQSTVGSKPVIGVGTHQKLDEVRITWPNGKTTYLTDVPVDQELSLAQAAAEGMAMQELKSIVPVFNETSIKEVLDFEHEENQFVDFDRDRLTYHMRSNEGPKLGAGDLNGDGLKDLVLGGSKGFSTKLYLKQANGSYDLRPQTSFELDQLSEDLGIAIYDHDNDGDLDIFIASGGNEHGVGDQHLSDRLYLNDGKANFMKAEVPLLIANRASSSVAIPYDINNDGYLDLFVGTRLRPFLYGVPASSHLYLNDKNGGFTNGDDLAPSLVDIGLVTDASWSDIDGDQDKDLIIVGEWMAPKVLLNENGLFKEDERYTENFSGWYNSIEAADLDGDGDVDFVLGNHGLNSRFKASADEPIRLYVNDFDQNGSPEQVFTRVSDDRNLPYVLKHELEMQIPGIKKRYLKYEAYNDQTLEEIFTEEQLQNAVTSEVQFLASAVMMNNGEGEFEIKALPTKAQYAPVYTTLTRDFNGDGFKDILLAGNLHAAKPQVGKYDANYGILLIGDGKGNFSEIDKAEGGLDIVGEVRDLHVLDANEDPTLLVIMNNEAVKAFKF
jgi:hypothetical protein